MAQLGVITMDEPYRHGESGGVMSLDDSDALLMASDGAYDAHMIDEAVANGYVERRECALTPATP
jgi:hypothetical protein